ncbi:hypothetical protein PRUB_a0182 [Pseudoalteromonas rubra]|uniref:Lipoprotein n=1 Tax=Pseudoalteromonas rubra TaxID=43658 RepID=A0A8T0C5X8_9GAMM|nr:hypothetical protein [Pseudoalteromonas rubra]KAF7785798.1 hypothetical protein PRUB_a0182 [Pseudoalteromonas rubra]
MNKYVKLLCVSVLPAMLLGACGGSGGASDTAAAAVSEDANSDVARLVERHIKPASLSINSDAEHYQIALIGNSHVSGLAPVLKQTIEAMAPDKTVSIEVLGFGFTDGLISDGGIVTRFTQPQTAWTHLIIQGQKYSQSMSKRYSTEATQQWIAMAKTHGATPILFPEHPQRGNTEEGDYVLGIHKTIANIEPSCLAPIPVAWELTMDNRPGVSLHAADGNHASTQGFLLSALVFTQIITGQSVDTGAVNIQADVEPQLQAELAQHAAQAIIEHPACPEV